MTEKEDGRTKSFIDRRTFIKGTAATAAVAAGGVVTAAADGGDDYDVIRVPAGQTHRIQLRDGDSLENTLIDITANNAQFQINAHGDGWAIRNIGIRGRWDSTRQTSPLIASVTRGGEATIENYYWAEDRHAGTSYPNGPTGIFVAARHAGHLHIDRVNLQNFPDNSIYASSPGNDSEHSNPGNQGTVAITNSYSSGSRASNFRLGTDGSYLENCVAVGGDRGFWGYYGHTEVIDCDLSGASGGRSIMAGARAWRRGRQAQITVENTRFDSSATAASGNRINGQSAGSPQRTRPEEVEGVPLSPEEAASGSSSGGLNEPERPDDGDEQEEEEDLSIEDVWNDDEPNHVELRGDSADEVTEYRIAGYGTAEAGENADTNPDDPYRDAVENAGETFEISGYLGGFVDDFYLEGYVEDVETTVDLTAVVNGEEFDFADLEGVGTEPDLDDDGSSIEDVWNDDEPNHVELRGGSADEIAEYRIAGYGTAEAGENADTNPDDPYRDAVENAGESFEISGYLGGFVDDFYLEGYVEDVETTVALTAVVNGEEFDFADLEGVGTEPDLDEDESSTDDGDDEPSTVGVRFSGRLVRIWPR
ncbi:twin-arginine translocation signal domain-containing protein [Natrialbaceae archaeon A-gly3]